MGCYWLRRYACNDDGHRSTGTVLPESDGTHCVERIGAGVAVHIDCHNRLSRLALSISFYRLLDCRTRSKLMSMLFTMGSFTPLKDLRDANYQLVYEADNLFKFGRWVGGDGDRDIQPL